MAADSHSAPEWIALRLGRDLFGLQRFDQLRRRMLEGFILVFLPLLLYGYWGAASRAIFGTHCGV